MWASANGHVHITRMLLESGADMHATDKVLSYKIKYINEIMNMLHRML